MVSVPFPFYASTRACSFLPNKSFRLVFKFGVVPLGELPMNKLRLSFCAVFMFLPSLLAQDKPIASLQFDFERVVSMVPEPPPEVKLQIDTIRRTGIEQVRLSLFSDKDRVVVPVLRISGNMEALQASLDDQTSIFRAIANPVGSDGI